MFMTVTSQQFASGALISLSITVFTVISTIYPLIVTPEKTNININREIIKLRKRIIYQFKIIKEKIIIYKR